MHIEALAGRAFPSGEVGTSARTQDSRREQVSSAWSSDARLGKTEGPRLAWTHSDVLQRFVQRRLSGNEEVGFVLLLSMREPAMRFKEAISVGCSTARTRGGSLTSGYARR